jgi:hypothetical protein
MQKKEPHALGLYSRVRLGIDGVPNWAGGGMTTRTMQRKNSASGFEGGRERGTN